MGLLRTWKTRPTLGDTVEAAAVAMLIGTVQEIGYCNEGMDPKVES